MVETNLNRKVVKNLEIGKDYISKDMTTLIINRSGKHDNTGIKSNVFSKDLDCWQTVSGDWWYEATEEEVIEKFEQYLQFEYGHNWENIIITETPPKYPHYGNNNNFTPKIYKDEHGWVVRNKNGIIYGNENWAALHIHNIVKNGDTVTLMKDVRSVFDGRKVVAGKYKVVKNNIIVNGKPHINIDGRVVSEENIYESLVAGNVDVTKDLKYKVGDYVIVNHENNNMKQYNDIPIRIEMIKDYYYLNEIVCFFAYNDDKYLNFKYANIISKYDGKELDEEYDEDEEIIWSKGLDEFKLLDEIVIKNEINNDDILHYNVYVNETDDNPTIGLRYCIINDGGEYILIEQFPYLDSWVTLWFKHLGEDLDSGFELVENILY